jgi:hypothetical protein
MNHEQAKLKSSSRRFRDENIIKKQLKIAKLRKFEESNTVVKQPHRLVKHHAMDCGTPNCPLCGNRRHSKLTKTKEKLTKQEQSFFQDLDNTTDKHSNGILPPEE